MSTGRPSPRSSCRSWTSNEARWREARQCVDAELDLRAGERVLDVGCGSGDAARGLAALVGPGGRVVGVDRSETMIREARRRLAGRALPVAFQQRTQGFLRASLPQAISKVDAPDPGTIRVRLAQPAADFILAIAAAQSVMVARELVDQRGDLKEGPMIGTVPFLIEKTEREGTSVARRNSDYFLPGIPYVGAGLPPPRIRAHALVGGGPDWEGFAWIAGVLRSLLPRIVELGIASAEDVGVETLADRLRAEFQRGGAAAMWMPMIDAWARRT
jgi:SAM-dependent methyltransferase